MDAAILLMLAINKPVLALVSLLSVALKAVSSRLARPVAERLREVYCLARIAHLILRHGFGGN